MNVTLFLSFTGVALTPGVNVSKDRLVFGGRKSKGNYGNIPQHREMYVPSKGCMRFRMQSNDKHTILARAAKTRIEHVNMQTDPG